MKNSWLAVCLAILVLMIGLAYYLWQSRQVAVYQLEVINQSADTVDYVKLFGKGAQSESTLNALLPGQAGIISVILKKAGGLKFEVAQGGNRIDSIIVKDIHTINAFQQQLVVHPNNRYIISDYDELSISD